MSEEVGAFEVITPGEVLDDMRSITTEISIIQNTLMDAPNADERVKNAFSLFADEWAKFYSENDNVVSRAMNATIFKVAEYKRRLRDWQEALKRENIKVYTTDLYRPKDTPGSLWDKIPWWVYGGLGVVFVWFLWPEAKRSHHKQED